MTTDVEIQEVEIEEVTETPEPTTQELQAEANRLLAFKKEHVRGHNQTPCASCGTYVPIASNACSHCNSNIAANNALIRESLRRLDEISKDLDGQHGDQDFPTSSREKRSFGERIKNFFSSDSKERNSNDPLAKNDDQRLLDGVYDGGRMVVIDQSGPWYKVKTSDGKVGWVFSTIQK